MLEIVIENSHKWNKMVHLMNFFYARVFVYLNYWYIQTYGLCLIKQTSVSVVQLIFSQLNLHYVVALLFIL